MSFDPDRVVPTQDQRNVQLLVNAGRRIRAPEPTVAVGRELAAEPGCLGLEWSTSSAWPSVSSAWL